MTLDWMTEAGRQTLDGGYLLDGETPENMYARVSTAAANQIGKGSLWSLFYEAMRKNWLCPASPVLSNMGTTRGLPISCFGLSVPDSVDGIFKVPHEMAMMSKYGGGVGIGLSHIRARGSRIATGAVSEGIVPWSKVYDSTIVAVSQGSTRRGAGSFNLNMAHGDIQEYLRMRRPTGDINRQCLNMNQCVQISDDFMESLKTSETNQELWRELMRTRLETGEPYIMFEDTVNRANPDAYRLKHLNVDMTNICSEITLHTDDDHSFVCCLSSLNLARYDEWCDYKFDNGMTLPELAVYFLNGVMNEFIARTANIPGMQRARLSALKGRSIGLGVLGWHTYLQSHMLPFDTSVEVMGLNSRIFKFIRQEATKASSMMATSGEYPTPYWCEGTGQYNTHLMALAPTVSNSIISGGVSASIEPIPANAYTQKTAKGVFTYKNPLLVNHLDFLGKNTSEVWKSIVNSEGSVQHLDFLTDGTKEVFLTAREINQFNIIRQAAARQVYIDQAQSLNLFFPVDVDPQWFHKIHMEAWRSGVKTLYYCRSGSVLKSDVASRFYDPDCVACEG